MYYFRMYEVTKNEAYKTLAKSVLASAERNMRNITNQELELMGIGAFTGFTGHIYMFCKIVERGWLAKEEQKEWEEVIDNLVTYLHNNMEKELACFAYSVRMADHPSVKEEVEYILQAARKNGQDMRSLVNRNNLHGILVRAGIPVITHFVIIDESGDDHDDLPGDESE